MYESSEECELEASLTGWFGIIASPISITNLTFLVGGALPAFLEDLSAEALVHLMLHLVFVGDASLGRRAGVVADCLIVFLVGLREQFSSDKDDDDKDDVLGRLIPVVGASSFTRVPVQLGPSSLRSNDDDDDERAEPSKALTPELWLLFIPSGRQYNFAMQTFGVAPTPSFFSVTPLAIELDTGFSCLFSTIGGIAATSGR